jgi:NADH-quinone oxidoreductase subunit J
MIQTAVFYILAAFILVSAVLVVNLKNVFHSALMLIAVLSGVAGIYAFLSADFLFAVQLLVYVGGIMVVLIFVVLLSGKPSDWTGVQVNEKAWAAGLFSLLFVSALSSMIASWPLIPVTAEPQTTTGPLGQLLLHEMVLPLEAISLVLLAALVGAIYFSARKMPAS